MARIKFSLTSPHLNGNILIGYDANGQLDYIDATNANATALQISYVKKHVPVTLDAGYKEALAEFIGTSGMLLTQVKETVSFEAFWEAYDKKINKARCIPLFAKLKAEQLFDLLDNVEQYKRYLVRTGYRNPVDPENYLKNKMFENDWKKLNK